MLLNSAEVQGYTYITTSNLNKISISGLTTSRLVVESPYPVNITNGEFELDFTQNNSNVSLHRCVVSYLGTAGAGHALNMSECTITSTALPSNTLLHANNCTFTNNIVQTYGCVLYAHRCTFQAFTVEANLSITDATHCRFLNSIALGAGNPGWRFGESNLVIGTVAATLLGPPLTTAQNYTQGMRTYNLLPVVGQPKSWVCVQSGVGGVALWASEGNL
jgi:hypothetical protein